MKFHDYTTLHQIARTLGYPDAQRLGAVAWYRQAPANVSRDDRDRVLRVLLDVEGKWIDARRPYYSVWPSIVPSLLRLHLDLDAGLIRLPLPQLLIRFAHGHEPGIGGRNVRSLMVTSGEARKGQPGAMLWADFGDTSPEGMPDKSCIGFPLIAGQSVEQCLSPDHYDSWVESSSKYAEALRGCVRLVCTLCLLANDPDLIEPEPLSEDQAKYDEHPEQRLIDKAVKRGKRGWRVGARLQADPHYRRPHVALRWTGEGRTVPKIVPVKGSIVHRRKITQVPTGYMDDPLCALCGKRPANTQRDGLCDECRQREDARGFSSASPSHVVPPEVLTGGQAGAAGCTRDKGDGGSWM